VVTVGTGPGEVPIEAVLVHDEANEGVAHVLAKLGGPSFPTPIGILRAVREPTLNEMVVAQEQRAVSAKGAGTLHSLLHAGETWKVAATSESESEDEDVGEELGAGGE